jgi:type II secretory pathway component PulK
MMKLRTKQRRRQKGLTIVLALIVMALGSLVITGLLYFVSTSLVAHGNTVDSMKAQYAADAGVEWFAAEVMADFSKYDDGDIGADLWAAEGCGTINNKAVRVEIANYSSLDGGVNTRNYIIESTSDDITVKAQVLAADVGGNATVAVHEWELS